VSATFLDFDGTLADTNLVQVCAFYCRHAGAPGDAVARQAKLLASVPAFLALDRVNRAAFARRLFSFYRGISEDRLERLSRRMHDEVIAPRVFAGTRDFLDGCRRSGPLVLVTGATDFSVRHFAEEYGIDHVIATRLEFRDGVATGRVVPPSVFGSNKARLLREWARERDIDLELSAAYADSVSDASMLDAVGRGGVINPNRRLAALAKDYHWQILNFD
jgi:HAD superfamily hydrolase (TIGR01490 family)